MRLRSSFVMTGVVVTALAAAANPRGRRSATLTAAPSADPSAPELGNTSWLNADHAVRLAELRGRAVLLNFWVFTCYNCTNTVPSLVEFDRRYRDRGLTLIGIHTPEFPPYGGEHDKGNLSRALAKLGITYPNAQDNDHRTWDTYDIRFWPSFVLIDKRGKIRFSGYGEFHLNDADFRVWDARIRELLVE